MFINNDNYNYNEVDNTNEEYIFEKQNENRNEEIVHIMNDNNASEYTTPESTSSAQIASQTETSTNTHFVRIPTRSVNPRQNTYDPQLYEVVQDETPNITSLRDTSVNVSSPTIFIYNKTRNITRSRYDPPSIPIVFQQSNTTIQPVNNSNTNQQISSRYYDPFNYSFFHHLKQIFKQIIIKMVSQSNNNTNSMTHHPYAHLLQTNLSRNNFPPQNQRTTYSNIAQHYQRRSQNPLLSQISTDPLYQMNQHTTHNPITNLSPVNMVQSVAPPLQYMPIQDTFINTSASIPEPMKPFDCLDHSYTPEECLQQVEARLTFAIGEETQNNPVKYRSWHNRRMAYIQYSLIGTALDWYTNLQISYKQQWNSFVQMFKKQFSYQKTAYYAQVEAMSLMKKDNETVRHFALRVQQ